MKFQLSKHAKEEMVRREIKKDVVANILDDPEQIVDAIRGRKVYQSRIDFESGVVFLVRVILDMTVDPTVVVTVYRTSKIHKYWRRT